MADETINDVVILAGRGEYDLPEIQREFVWKSDQVRILCDSLYQGYPIGTLLIWDNPEYIEPRQGEPDTRRPRWIVDGQQRVTTLCLLFGQKPFWYGPSEWTDLRNKNRVFINVELATGRVDFSGRNLGSEWESLPVQEILSKPSVDALYELASEHGGGDPSTHQRLLTAFIKLWNSKSSQMPVLQITGKEPEDIASIFERFNRRGTRVKETDIRFAIIAAHNQGFVRNEISPFLEDLEERGWDIPPGYLLQSMIVLDQGKARMSEVDRTYWRSSVQQAWGKLKDAVDEVITLLWDNGIPNIDLIPSEYTLIPLFALHARFGKTRNYSFERILKWFLIANMEGRYSGAPLEILTKDAAAIHSKSTLDEALLEMPPENTPTKEDLAKLFSEQFRKGSFSSLLLHLLLWNGNARDWLQELTLRAASTNHGVFQPHWHHIVPKAWAKRNGLAAGEAAANITILTETTNVRKLGARPPWEYVSRNNIPQQALEDHFIPEQVANRFVSGAAMTSEELAGFLEERANLLADNSVKLLGY